MTRPVLASLCAIALLSGCGAATEPAQRSSSASPLRRVERMAAGVERLSGRYRESSGSMEPTLPPGVHFEVRRGPLSVGEIVVFHPPQGWLVELCGPRAHRVKPGGPACAAPVAREESGVVEVKRVVAGPGDRIYVRAGRVFRRAGGHGPFVREPDSFAKPCAAQPACDFPVPIVVPAGHWFLMGDNRGESLDSREFGPVPTAWIMGIAVV